MGAKSNDRRRSFGLTWAEQWDYAFNDQEAAAQKNKSIITRLADYNKKMKSAALLGLEKSKAVAFLGAKKVKGGTKSSLHWVKDHCDKKSQN
ncbi:hypothetical protein SUGI_1193360 [Cryptomeria japonica]|nr:hypothetical protein SUGI_1193360 [Cryptomeria japonica]